MTSWAWRTLTSAAIARWHEPSREALVSLVRQPQADWQELAALMVRHGLIQQVTSSLLSCDAPLPDQVRSQFRRRSNRMRMRSLALAGDMAGLCAVFEDSNIPMLILKGPVLGFVAYGDAYARDMGDIDVYVRPSDVSRAALALTVHGYAAPPDLVDIEFAVERMQYGYELTFAKRETQTHVDLHWRLFSNRRLFPMSIDCALAQAVSVGPFGSASVPSLPPEEHFIYVCVHGAKHQWMRLKWLCDVYVFALSNDLDWAQLGRVARELDAERQIAEAATFASELFGAELPPEAGRLTVRHARRRTKDVTWFVTEPLLSARRGHSLATHLRKVRASAALKPSIPYKVSCLKVFIPHENQASAPSGRAHRLLRALPGYAKRRWQRIASDRS